MLRLTITNPNGATTLTGVSVADALPGSVVVATPPGVVGNCNGGTVTAVAGSNSVSLAGGSIPGGTNCVITVNVTSPTGGTFNNTTGRVSANESGQGATSNTTPL